MCCAAAIGGDNLQDLKCGQLVGSTPWKQQVMQILGVVVAALVMAPVLNLLHTRTASARASRRDAARGAAGEPDGHRRQGRVRGGLPWIIIGIGAAIAAVVIVIDACSRRAAEFRVPVMAFAVGVYLPFDLQRPIFLGGVIAHLATRWHKRREPGKAGDPSGWACSPPPA